MSATCVQRCQTSTPRSQGVLAHASRPGSRLRLQLSGRRPASNTDRITAGTQLALGLGQPHLRHCGLAAAAQFPALRHSTVCSAAVTATATSSWEEDNGPTKVDKAQVIKVISLGLLFFTSTFNYTILQNLRDFLIVTKVGAEALPFLEAYGVLPVSLAFYVLYNKLNHALPEKWVYQAALLPFLAFYALFGAVLYPLADKLHPTHLLDGMRAALPAGFVGLASVVVNWSYSLFFIMGELWGGVAISLLFWGLADEVCTMREAESVYPLLGIIANIGLVLSGAWIKTVNHSTGLLAGWGLDPVQALLGTILVVSCALMVIKGFVQERFVVTDAAVLKSTVKGKKEKKEKKEKKKAAKSLGESLAVFKRNPKVGNLAVLVIAYFIAQKLFDISWKAQLKVMYPDPAACQTALAEVSQWTGVATICLMATSKFVFRHGGWSAAALATPILIMISGAAFFASSIAVQGGATALGPQAVAALLAVGGVAGIVGRVASKAPKYSLFDPAKEMVYITMKDKQEKTEGKAAVDLLGSYFGKSGASWIMQLLVLGVGSLNAALPFIALIHLVVCAAWTRATFSLGALMKVQMEEESYMASTSGTPTPEPDSYGDSNGSGGSATGGNGPVPVTGPHALSNGTISSSNVASNGGNGNRVYEHAMHSNGNGHAQYGSYGQHHSNGTIFSEQPGQSMPVTVAASSNPGTGFRG